MDNRKKSTIKTIVLCVLVVIVIAVVGISFAYFTVTFDVGDTYSLGGKAKNNTPEIDFTENKSGITLDGTYPMPDSVGMEKSDEYTFTVTGKNNTQNIKINVYLQVAESNTLADNLVNVSYNGQIKTVNTLPTGDPIDAGFNKAYKLDTFVIGPNGSDTNYVRMWVNESGTTSNALNKNWSSKIYVVPEYTEEEVVVRKGRAVDLLMNKVNAASITDYNSGNKGEMFTFTHPEAKQTTGWSEAERTDYRYIGNTPNNYIQFNNETWRIIGVFTVEGENKELEQRIKIIRDQSIGSFPWDKKAGGTYTNEWPTSSLATMLNGDYVNKGGSFTYTWYNSSGTAKNTTVQGLNSTAKSQISPTKWYLGGNSTLSESGPTYYNFERGTTVYSGRSTNWVASVGLMYPSDYIYTYSNGVDNTCFQDGYNCETSEGGTPESGWLFNSEIQWTITPHSSNSNYVFILSAAGFVYNVLVSNNYASRPVVYLRSDIEIISGTGTQNDPYILKS